MTDVWNKEENRRVNMLVLLTLLSYLVGSIFVQLTDETAVQLVVIQVFCLAPGLIALAMRREGTSFGRAFADTYRVHKTRISVVLLAAVMMLFLLPLLVHQLQLSLLASQLHGQPAHLRIHQQEEGDSSDGYTYYYI